MTVAPMTYEELLAFYRNAQDTDAVATAVKAYAAANHLNHARLISQLCDDALSQITREYALAV